MEAAQEVNNKLEESMSKVFTNDVIWKYLGNRLSHVDLKECRLVCHQFNQSVLNSTNFRRRSSLNLRGNYGDITHSPSNVDSSYNKSMPSIFQEFESVTLTALDFFCHSSEIPIFHQLLAQSTKLKRLKVDVQIVIKFTQEDAVQLYFNLNELEIVSKTHLDSREHRQAMVNLHQILKCASKLRMLRIPSLLWENRFGPAHADIMSAQHLMAAIELNENWTDLSLPAIFWTAMSSKPPVEFKNLKSLTLSAWKSETDFVGRFLRQQESLKRLDMSIAGPLTLELLHVIKTLNLKSLKIKCRSMLWDVQTWGFLSTSTLTEFAFHLHKGSACLDPKVVESFFNNLPSTLVKFKCRGIRRERRIPLDCYAIELRKLESKRLIHLDLSRCIGLVTDSTVEFICRNFKLLQYLDLSNSRATDYGLTGKNKENGPDGALAEFSLTDLRGLKVLVLQKCWKIGDKTLGEAIQFLELKELDLRGNEQFSERAIWEMVTRNPSLRTLRTSCMSKKLDSEQDMIFHRRFLHEIQPSDDSDEEEPRSSSSDFVIHSNVAVHWDEIV